MRHLTKGGICLLAMIGLLATACSSDDKSADVLSEKQMIRILADMYVLEEKVSRLPVPFDSANHLFPRFRDKYLQEAGISEETFKRSWQYYMNDPKKLDRMYTAVIDSLNLREQSFPEAVTDAPAK